MVGLKNQGATCYLNSLLQSLYFTNLFRKSIYQIPTENEQDYKGNSAYALQRLFYQLQTSNAAVSTNELTKAFGWDSRQIFEQQDVQELSRVLMERMEEKMKGTDAQDALPRMFIGKTKTYISCINVDYESSRIEDFWDIQLNVSGNKNLDDSFKDYINVETMEGENKYFAEGFGLQDARKGVIFESFPAVLHLQLKRFEYDFQRDAMMKINDRYEFPEIWDATPYLSKEADKTESYVYHLHGVLVHSGDLNAGHYYAFLKPEAEGHWFKFDDDRVMRSLPREAISDNFGGEFPAQNGAPQRNPYTRTWTTKRSNNAYMLVYIRQTRLNHILCPSEEVQPPEHLARKIAEEKALQEKLRKERDEAHLYMEVYVATDENFKAHQGFDIGPWKAEAAANEAALPKGQRILKTKPVAEFVKEWAEEAGIDPRLCRPWAMVNRQNGTVRPDRIIAEPEITIEQASNTYGTKSAMFKIWMELSTELDKDGSPVFADTAIDQSNPQNRPVVLFLKYFDAENQTLFGVGNFYAGQQDRAADLAPHVLRMFNWPAGTAFKMFEEIKHNMIEPIKSKQTLAQSEIQDGDIITVQKNLTDKEASAITAAGKIADCREYYDNLLHKVKVKFAPKFDDGSGKEFELELSKRMNYNTFAQKVAEALGPDVQADHLRFSPVNAHTGRPKAPVRHTTTHNLGTLLQPGYNSYGQAQNQRTDAFYYEVLEVSLTELEQRKGVKITWLPEGILKEEAYEVLVPKSGNLDDVAAALQRKVGSEIITDEKLARMRIFEGHANKIYRDLPMNWPVTNLSEFTGLFAEIVPEGEMKGEYDEETEGLLGAFQYDKEVTKPHGIPFYFLVRKGEPFKETKERLQKRTGIKGKAFERIKFASVARAAYGKLEYLEDGKYSLSTCLLDCEANFPSDEILWDKAITQDINLGLDHTNKTRSIWNKAENIFIK
jgi:ubiquitin carboxyl-terminal hydrolase 7